jgi:hypothetical protein
MHVCMSCYEFYDGKFLNQEYSEIFCPKSNCHSEVIELDELIAPTIILLNQKGYFTKFCCAGHWYEPSSTPYIYFHEEYIPDTIPISFTWDDHKDRMDTIRARYVHNENETKYDFVTRVNKELYEWALSLPEAEWV